MRLCIHESSHRDHGLSHAHLDFIVEVVSNPATHGGLIRRVDYSPIDGIHVYEIDLEDCLSPLRCALHGPIMGDERIIDEECTMENRGARAWTSRLCQRPSRETRIVTVIAGPHDGHPLVMYTAYAGPTAPREPGDPALKVDSAEHYESAMFWRAHALSDSP